MKKALILGGSGFVGGWLCERLRAEGWFVGVTGSRIAPDTGADESFALNILDAQAVEALFRSFAPDGIFHLAAQSSAALSWKEPAMTVDVNIRGTVNVLEAARALPNRPRLLLIGSSEEYGTVREEECPLREEQTPRPGNVYAVTKVTQELLGQLYANAYGMDIVMTRSFNHVGPGQSDSFALSDFCRQTALIERGERESVIRTGNLEARREFTDVRDVVRAYALLMEKGVSGRIYNVGRGSALRVREALEMILSLSDRDITAETDPARFRPVDAPLNMADITRLTADTGWTPEIPLEQTLLDMLDWWREHP